MFFSILPEILILVLIVLLLVLEPFWKEENRRSAGWMTAGGLLAIMAVSLLVGRPGDPEVVFGGMIRFDWLGFFFKMMFIFAAGITALFMMDHEVLGKRGDSYILLLSSLLGMNMMASSADLIMLYLAIETTSIPLYVLAGFMISDKSSTEAGFKYLLYGAMASAIMLYGFSLLFGFAGTTNIYELAAMTGAGQLSLSVILGVVVMVIVGLGFKVSIVPFHFWAPDTYTGAPTPVAFPFLGSRYLYWCPNPGSRIPFYSFKGCWVCGIGALVYCGFSRISIQLGLYPGYFCCYHNDSWQLGCFEANQYQALVGVLIDCTCRLCHDWCGDRFQFRCYQRGLLFIGLHRDQPGSIRNCHDLLACHRLGSD
jgi:NADH-quinone oxidoreductase subunit N